jgi:hypothetical protein
MIGHENVHYVLGAPLGHVALDAVFRLLVRVVVAALAGVDVLRNRGIACDLRMRIVTRRAGQRRAALLKAS